MYVPPKAVTFYTSHSVHVELFKPCPDGVNSNAFTGVSAPKMKLVTALLVGSLTSHDTVTVSPVEIPVTVEKYIS